MVDKMSDREIKFKCKILPYGNFVSIAIAVNISIFILYVCIFIGLPTIISTMLLLGAMFLIFSFLSNEAIFTLSQTSLSKTLEKNNFLFKNKAPLSFFCSDLKTYKQGTDKGKYRGEIEYLELKFINGEVWKITDMYGERKSGFEEYQAFFIETINKINSNIHTKNISADIQNNLSLNTSNVVFIKREKTFYETIFAKIFTVLLGIIIAIFFTFSLYLNATSWFKLIVVLIPGFIYMVFRAFIKKYP